MKYILMIEKCLSNYYGDFASLVMNESTGSESSVQLSLPELKTIFENAQSYSTVERSVATTDANSNGAGNINKKMDQQVDGIYKGKRYDKKILEIAPEETLQYFYR